MDRITNKHLEGMIARLNKLTNSPDQPYAKGADGRYKAQIGCFHLAGAYGGVGLHRICNDGGGVTTPIGSGYMTKRELYERLFDYIRGIE